MTNKILGVIRMIMLLIVIAFVVLFGYKYYTAGELNYSYLAPIAGLLVFYFITKPKTK
jgi:hypothetical protein